jgi:hypothetical protein
MKVFEEINEVRTQNHALQARLAQGQAAEGVPWLVFTDRNLVWCQRCGFKRGATGELMPIDTWIAEMKKLIEEHRNCVEVPDERRA